MNYRLGLDMGATSIGWSIYDIENEKILDTGVRIFDDGREAKTKASLCVKRRNARSARKLTNRRHIKTQELLKTLIEMGLFPQQYKERENLKNLNPYKLRKEALDKKLSLYELGRTIMQLAKRKGFKSNRKDNREEGGKLKKGFEELKDIMQKENARTYGEFLYNRLLQHPEHPIRLKNVFDENGKFQGGPFPFRETYVNEFEQIWDKQKDYYPQVLTDENKNQLKNIIFFQRPLKETEEGECQFEKGEKRIPRAHPLFQEFRIWQNALNLTFSAENELNYRPLENVQNLISLLMNPQNVTPNKQGIIIYSNIKKALGLDKNGVFNYERQENRNANLEKGLLVNTTQNAINKSVFFAPYWNNFSDEQKGELINIIMRPHNYILFPQTRISIEEEDGIIIKFLKDKFNLSKDAAEELLFDIDLENDFGSLSEKAINKILPFMRQGHPYHDACLCAGYHHSFKEYDHLDKLPYYGELLEQSCLGKKTNPTCAEEKFGKINNATVHVALNQIRHLVNEIITRYGKPYDIAVEYARDLSASAKERQHMMDIRDKNEKENQRIQKELQEKLGNKQYSKNDIQKYKIWKKLPVYGKDPLVRECPFSGAQIPLSELLNDGQQFQIEHLIPFSRSLDDSLDNKVIATVEANRYKKNRTPFEAFGRSENGYNWDEIQQRAKKLSIEQQWRFAPDAMQRFEKQEGPIARSLNDTRYMTRLLQDYLQPIVKKDGKQRVQSVAGRLTFLVRRAWGLNVYKEKEDNDKYREFHNHHAIDAIIVSAINRAQISNVVGILANVRDNIREEFKDKLQQLRDSTVSDEEKRKIKKEIHDAMLNRETAIVKKYFKLPKNIRVPDVLQQVAAINISHKPSLKNIKQKDSTIGQLHEDTAYGLQKFVDDKSLKAIFKTKKADDKSAKDKNTPKDVTQYIPMFRNKEDKKAYYDAFREWFIWNGKAKTIDAKTKEDKEIKANIAQKEQNAIQVLRQTSLKAFKWFVGGNNFCAEIYEINPNNKICGIATKDRGEWKIEIVSNYNATVRNSRGEDIAYWRYKYPNAKRIMSLRGNDMVMATFSKNQAFDEKFPKNIQEYVREKFQQRPDCTKPNILFRVKKMTAAGVIFLTPHDIAKEEGDTKSFGTSADAMRKYNLRKVHISYMGKIQNA